MNNFSRLAVAAGSMLFAVNAWANTATFTFDQDACSGTCGLSPFAKVTLVENGSGASETVTVTETFINGERFAKSSGEALAFNIAGTVTLTNLSTFFTSNFALGSGSTSIPSDGTFSHYIDCTTCQGGQAGNPAGPLQFTVGSSGGVSIASFTPNTGGYYFASDIVGSNGNTGDVATKTEVLGSVPEPGTVVMMLSGLFITGVGIRHRTRG